MKKLISVLVTGTLVTGLVSCANQPGEGGITRAQGGTVIGGVLGGIAGSQIGSGTGTVVAVIGGTLLGAFLGHQVGSYLDQQSQTAANRAAQVAFETGKTTRWQTSRAYGVVKPHSRYVTSTHRICRPFSTTIVMNGKARTAQGTACKNDRGIWVIQ